MKLTQDFYLHPAEIVAPALIGRLICCKIDGEIFRLRITETEAYGGVDDTACHAHKGRTDRTSIMYEWGGVAYVYLCYGIHNLLNVVVNQMNLPEAVLIRGVADHYGPGRLTRFLQIDRTRNGESFITSDRLWLEDDGRIYDCTKSTRIGIDYATEEYRNKLWRFTISE